MPHLQEMPSLFAGACAAPVSAPPVTLARQPNYIAGHRKRLRERFLTGGAAAMPDYELLEMILFQVMRQGDVKPVARKLLDTHGDLAAVLSAPVTILEQTPGVGAAIALQLKVVEAVTHRMARAKVMQKHVISSWDAVIDYCHTVMAHRDTEQFRILFLDTKNVLIADEEQARGTIDHVPVYPREVVKRALELNAAALLLVHNHPSGDPTPSQADIHMTAKIAEAAEALGISVHDHLIVGRSRELSFRAEGLL